MRIDKVREKLLDEFFKLDEKLQNKIIDNIDMIKAKLYLNLFECEKEDWQKSQFMFCLVFIFYKDNADDKVINLTKNMKPSVSTFHKLIGDSYYLNPSIGYVLGRYDKEIEDIEEYIPYFIDFLKDYASNIKD